MKKMSVLCIVVFTVFVILMGCTSGSKEKKERLYEVKIAGMGNVIVKQASACISLCRSYVATWEYAKATGTDFKAAAGELQGTETKRLKNQLIEGRQTIKEFLGGLENPPLKFAESYEKLIELREIYQKIHSLALNPPDSMEGFNDSINNLQNKLVDKKEELDSMLAKVASQQMR